MPAYFNNTIYSAGAEVGIVAALIYSVFHFEIVSDSKAAGRRNFQEGIAEVAIGRKATAAQSGVEGAVGIQKINVGGAIGGEARASHPDGAFAAIRRDVEHARLRQRGFAVTDDPSGVGTNVAVRGPCGVDDSVQQEERSAFFILRGIENYISAATVVAVSGEGCLNVDGTAEQFCAERKIQGVQTLMIISRTIFRHRDDIYRAVWATAAVDHWSRGHADFG